MEPANLQLFRLGYAKGPPLDYEACLTCVRVMCDMYSAVLVLVLMNILKLIPERYM